MAKKKNEYEEEHIKLETGLERKFITSLRIERRSCGRARALLMTVEIPASVSPPSYCDLVTLAANVFHDALPELSLLMRDADVMAWSDRRADHWLNRPYMYRVNATFVPEEDLHSDSEEGEEIPAPCP